MVPKPHEPPWASTDPIYVGAFEEDRLRRRRRGVRTPFLNAGQLALRFFRPIPPAKVAGAWGQFRGLGATHPSMAQIAELSIVRNTEAVSRYEKM